MHAWIQKVLPEGVQLWHFFLDDEGERNSVSLAGQWWPNIECWLGNFVIFQVIRTGIANKPFIFVIFQGGGGPDPLSRPPLDMPMKWKISCFC